MNDEEKQDMKDCIAKTCEARDEISMLFDKLYARSNDKDAEVDGTLDTQMAELGAALDVMNAVLKALKDIEGMG